MEKQESEETGMENRVPVLLFALLQGSNPELRDQLTDPPRGRASNRRGSWVGLSMKNGLVCSGAGRPETALPHAIRPQDKIRRPRSPAKEMVAHLR